MVPSMARGRAVTMMGVSRKKRKQQKASASGTAVEAATSQDDAPSISQALQEPTAAEVKLSTGASTGGSKAGQAAGVEPVFALASMELLSAPTRVGSLAAAPSYEDVRKALLGVAADEDSMVEFVQANRDLLDYRFLYRMTADLLRAENTGDQGGASLLREARARAVQATQRFDAPLFQEVAEAESRLGGLLAQYMQGTTPKTSAVVQAAGSTPLAIFAFWLVVLAAVAAWEVKLSVPAVEAQATQKLQELSQIRSALESDDSLMSRAGIAPLIPLAALPDMSSLALGSPSNDASHAAALLAEAGADAQQQLAIVRRIGCTYCQAQRHGFQAYNAMVQRMAALHDVLLYGERKPLDAVDIQAPPRSPSSAMVKMANDADAMLQEQGIDIPLFW